MSGGMREPVECRITLGGQPLGALSRWLREVTVDTGRRSASVATLVFETLRDETGRWAVQDEPTLRPWSPIRIDACFGSRCEEVMRGWVRELRVDTPQDMAAASVTVIAQDETLALDREHLRQALSRSDAPLTDGQLAQKIASEHGLLADVQPGLTHSALNADTTAVRLLQERAEANGFEFGVRAGTLYFGPPPLGGQPQPTIVVHGGPTTNCLRLATRFDGHRPDQVRLVRPADASGEPETQTLSPDLPLLGRQAADSAGAGLPAFVWTLPRPAGATAAEATARAQAQVNESAWKLFAEGELDGALYEHVLQPRRTVNVDGVGDVYGGLYYVDEVQHRFSAAGYRQVFKLLRNALGDQGGASADPLAALR